MLSTVVLATTSFNGVAPLARPSVRSNVRMGYDLSKELGYDVETGGPWDPLNYAEKSNYNFAYYRALELKHGRVAMLATLGFFVPELFGTWPNDAGLFDGSNPITAITTVPPLGLLQIVGVVGLIESTTGKGAEGGRVPGDIGFDPLGLSADGIDEKLALAELKNGRLAMIASIAFIVQTALTGKGIIASTFDVLA